LKAKRSFLLALVGGAALATAAGWCVAEPIQHFTRPSDLRQLSFTRPGRIAEVPVKEGDTVKAGDVLMKQDDSIEQKERETLEMLAEDDTRIEFAKLALAKAEVDLEATQFASSKEGVSPWELREAELEVKLKAASLSIAELEKRQAQADLARMEIRLKQMQLVSPMDGRVERVVLREGEAADALEKVILIVQTDPLWVDLPVPVGRTRDLRIGQKARVRYLDESDGDGRPPIEGVIIHKATMADSASGWLTVRVEFPNPRRRAAGQYVQVEFDAEVPTAKAE